MVRKVLCAERVCLLFFLFFTVATKMKRLKKTASRPLQDRGLERLYDAR